MYETKNELHTISKLDFFDLDRNPLGNLIDNTFGVLEVKLDIDPTDKDCIRIIIKKAIIE